MAELAITDLATVDKRIDTTARKAKSGDKKFPEELEFLKRLREHLNEVDPRRADLYHARGGCPARALPADGQATPLRRQCERGYAGDRRADAGVPGGHTQGRAGELAHVAARARACQARAAQKSSPSPPSSRLSSASYPAADAAEYLAALGLPALGADRVIQAGYKALNLISFLTAGEDEVRAWTVTRGSKAPVAAGKIHTDFEKGFIRAEVVTTTT